jgi:hypothetical protein
MILTSVAARDLRAFTISSGATMLTDRDDVHPERWSRDRYAGLRRFRTRNGIEELPSKLSREDIFGAFRSVPTNVAVAFLWTMMWGYQSEGTGAYRIDVALSSRNRVLAEDRLASIVASARMGNLPEAFSLMRGTGTRIRNVNTAFGTKLFYFAGYDEMKPVAAQPLILDKRVASALHKVLADPSEVPATFTDLTLCTFDEYRWYLDVASRIRDDYVPNHRIDVVEFFLWCHA